MARLTDGAAREIILERASELFLAEGARQVSIRKIATAVGVTPMALYRHFRDKEDLHAQLLQHGFATFAEYLARSDAGSTAAERLDLLVEGFRDFAFEQGAYFELIFLTGETLDGLRDRKEVRRVAGPTFKRLVVCVQDAMDEDVLRAGRAEDVALCLLAQCTGLVALHRSGTFRWSGARARRQFDASFAAVLAGFRV